MNAVSLVSLAAKASCGCGVFGCVGFFVGVLVFAWFGLVSQLSLCFFACLRSFTDWCIAHRQQSREQKNRDLSMSRLVSGLALVPNSASSKKKCHSLHQIPAHIKRVERISSRHVSEREEIKVHCPKCDTRIVKLKLKLTKNNLIFHVKRNQLQLHDFAFGAGPALGSIQTFLDLQGGSPVLKSNYWHFFIPGKGTECGRP